jgi:hypothetical protein
MNRQQLFTLAGCVLACAALSACGTGPSSVFQALKDDDADVCATVSTSVAGYAGGLTFCRAKSANGGTVSVDKAGVTTITRNGQPVAQAAPKPSGG